MTQSTKCNLAHAQVKAEDKAPEVLQYSDELMVQQLSQSFACSPDQADQAEQGAMDAVVAAEQAMIKQLTAQQ